MNRWDADRIVEAIVGLIRQEINAARPAHDKRPRVDEDFAIQLSDALLDSSAHISPPT